MIWHHVGNSIKGEPLTFIFKEQHTVTSVNEDIYIKLTVITVIVTANTIVTSAAVTTTTTTTITTTTTTTTTSTN